MATNLQKSDWERIKAEAEQSIREATILKLNGELMLNRAIKELKKFPDDKSLQERKKKGIQN